MSPFYLPTNANDSLMHEALKYMWQYFYSEHINSGEF